MRPVTRVVRHIARRLRQAGWQDVKVERSPVSCSHYITAWEPETCRDTAFRISDHDLPSGNGSRYYCIDLRFNDGRERPIEKLIAEAEALVKDVIEDA